MKRFGLSILVGSIVLGGLAHAQPSAPPVDSDTTLRGVTVVGGKIMPTTEDPKSATCEFLVATDPGLRAQIQAAAKGGDPFYMAPMPGVQQGDVPASPPSALLGPRIFQPTRAPLEIDPVAEPLSPPGSPLPDIGRQYQGLTTLSTTGADVAGETAKRGESRLYDAAAPAMDAYLPQYSGEDAMAACRVLREPGGGTPSPGRYEIAYRDTTLPTAMALFAERRYAESLDYFHRAFDKLPYEMGGDEAALMIGKLMMGAPGVPRDMPGAVVWLKKAAGARFDPVTDMPVFDPREPERNTAIGEASMILADIYGQGRGMIPRDPAQSRRFLDRAYAVGHIPAAKRLGDLYYEGKDAPRDVKKAFRAYMDAARFAHVPAMTAVAQMYEDGEVDGGPNPAKALAWRNQAAKLDDPRGLYALAVAYDHGQGVEADPERALGFYKVAAMNGEPAAYTALGAYFYEGEGGLERDPPVARRWFEQAALAGDPDGMFDFAVMLAKGEGGDLDRVRAWGWFRIAGRAGHPGGQIAARALEAQFSAEDRAGVDALTASLERPKAAAPGADPDRLVDPAFIGVAPGGPPWWKVSKGEATVWVFGLPTGRSLAAQSWNTAPLRDVLDDARLVIAPYSPWSRIETDNSPFNELPRPLGEKLTTAAARIRQPLRNRRPTLSDAVRLHFDFYRRARFSDEAPSDFYRMVVRKKVGLITPQKRPGPQLATLYAGGADVAACVEAILADMAAPAAPSGAASAAWADGDVGAALAAPANVHWACDVLWPGYRERSVGFTTEAIAMALDMPGKVVAAVDIGQLVARDGVLARLRDRGLEVSGPMQPTGQ